MKKILFSKYHGTGNDFIMIYNIENSIKLSAKEIAYLCDRHLGIGADGLMLLNKSDKLDFEMDYYNSDGSGATMCGNGARCIVAFAKKNNLISNKAFFTASDGLHQAYIDDNDIVKLKMADVRYVKNIDKNNYFCDTGSPHHIQIVDEIDSCNVPKKGSEIRNSKEYKVHGTNVDFVEVINENEIFVRTYERGVENETLSCGTGVVASALTYFDINKETKGACNIKTKGGDLTVSAELSANGYSNIWLKGKATFVFDGEIVLGI